VQASASALVIVGDCPLAVFGLPTAERLRRQFALAGISETLALDACGGRSAAIVLVRADAVIDQPLIAILARSSDLLLLGTEGATERPVAIATSARHAAQAAKLLAGEPIPPQSIGLIARAPSQLEAAFWKGLRKREVPYAIVVTPANLSEVEWRMYMGTYKGATDFITKHLWPVPAYHVTRFLAPRGISPNAVTAVGALLMAAAFWLFLEGWYLTGLAAAWGMTFLDTVDGKLARTTLTSSKWGDVFDHGIDLIHPPFWYVAWGLGLSSAGLALPDDTLWTVLGVILVGYVLQRLMEGIAIKWLGLEIHIWRPIDTLFRQITARRNPNLAILTLAALLGRPDLGLIAVAAWTGLCLLLHGVQLLHALWVRRTSGPLASWMEKSPSQS